MTQVFSLDIGKIPDTHSQVPAVCHFLSPVWSKKKSQAPLPSLPSTHPNLVLLFQELESCKSETQSNFLVIKSYNVSIHFIADFFTGILRL